MSSNAKYLLLFAALGGIFFLPFLGGVHLFDWDEVNFAEISREMLVLGDYLRVHVDFQPFYEKPPLFFWMQAAAMHVFGVGEFAARLPNALCGMVTLPLLFHLGKKLHCTRLGFVWAMAYFGSVLPHLYFKSGIIDPWFNLFIFLGLYFFILFTWKKDNVEGIPLKLGKWSYLIVSGLLFGAAVLTKGPVAYVVIGLCVVVYWVTKRFRFFISLPQAMVFATAALALPLLWFGLETLKNGPGFVFEFVKYQYRLFSTPDAGHRGFPGYHIIVLLVGCFPASVFCIQAFLKNPPAEKAFQRDFKIWMVILFWVVLGLFTIVRTKIVHYSSLCYFPLTYLAAVVIEEILAGRTSFKNWQKAMLVGIGGLFVLAVLALPWLGMNVEVIKPVVKDPFAAANLEAQVKWSGWNFLPGIWLLASLLLSFHWLTKEKLRKGFLSLFLGMAIFTNLGLIFFIKKIEGYSQRAAVEFCESLEGVDCYVRPMHYKSYVHLFYTKKMPPVNPLSRDLNWLLTREIDKDAYFITKIHKVDKLGQGGQVEIFGQKSGYIFFKRETKRE